MNPADIAASALEEHQRVRVQGEAGALEGIEVIPGSIRCGSALMFYPEANVLMRPVIDAVSGTPAFKRVPVLGRGGAKTSLTAAKDLHRRKSKGGTQENFRL